MSRYRLLPTPDRGVAVSAALSTGDLLHAPGLTRRERRRLRRLERKLARAKRGSNRRGRVKHAIARLKARETDRRKAGLNREILRSGWELLVRRLQDKAQGRVEKVDPAFTSQRCSACGQVDRDSRESQAVFRCTACGFAGHADVNAAINIAAGHPTHLPIPLHTRGSGGITRPVNCEPQLLLQSA